VCSSDLWPAFYFDKPDLWFDEWPEFVEHRVYALDPSKGSDSKSSDYQAHVMVALGQDRKIYVEADLRREDVAAMAERAITTAARFRANEMIVEENGTMGFIVPEFERRMAELKKVVPLRGLSHTTPKMSRIRGVGPYLARNQIRVRNTPGGRLLVQQWRNVPNGEFDDGPDAVATAIKRLELLVNGAK
jgi:predicted phage terminase large subunit-like protein